MWILLFTTWLTTAEGDYKADEQRAEFPTEEACSLEGGKRLTAAGEKGQPATFFCFKKGEKIG